MIEKIARALADVDATHAWREAHPDEWELYIEDAKAVLKALETPTPDMVEAGVAVQNANRWPRVTKAELAEDIFTAMIKAAAQEQGDG